MNKLILPAIILTLVFSIFSFFYTYSSKDLVYVDVNKLLDGYTRTSVEKAKFEEKASKLQANVDSLLRDWQQELKTFEKEHAAMSNKELALKKELLTSKQQQISNYQKAIKMKIQEEDQKITQTVINDINDYVKAYGEKNGHKIIFGASGTGNIMYADQATDLTVEILEGLNAEYSAK